MLLPALAIIGGLILLIWSADRFIDGAAATANHFGMSQLLIGIVIVGFGTSAPEMIVSSLSALNGNPGIALGNAYGSNITNIALILGTTALITPLAVNSQILRLELPILILITALSAALIYDAEISRSDAVILLITFAAYMIWTVWHDLKNKSDSLAADVQQEFATQAKMSVKVAVLWIFIGLLLLIGSSQLLVWGAVEVARYFGVSDLIIGLTIVAVGTSLPEFASSVVAARKGEADLAVGNIVGSNLFNALAVVGIAGVISPMQVEPEVFTRDMSVMTLVTVALLIFGYGISKKNARKITRFEGFLFLVSYIAYTLYLFKTAV